MCQSSGFRCWWGYHASSLSALNKWFLLYLYLLDSQVVNVLKFHTFQTVHAQVASPVPQEKSQSSLMQDPDPSWPFDEIDKERENIKTETQNPNSEGCTELGLILFHK